MESVFVRTLFLSLIILCIPIQITQATSNLLCSIDASQENYQSSLDQLLPEKFHIESLQYYITPTYSLSELECITGLQPRKESSRKDIACALFYLTQMGIFKSIILNIYQDSNNQSINKFPQKNQTKNYNFEFHIIKHAIFSKLTISGPLRGKERYKNAYLIDIGDVFDQQKHDLSVQALHKIFHEQGYFQAQVTDTITQDQHSALVYTHISLKKGKRFSIHKTNCNIDTSNHVSQIDSKKICKKIMDFCTIKLHTKHYSKELIKNIRHKIKHILEHNGFMIFDINIHEKVDLQQKTIDLDIHINVDRKKEFIFIGNSFFKHHEIINHLLLYGKSAWHFPSSVIIDEIMQFYKNKGFLHIEVSVREETNKVFCLIKEGPRGIISHIQLKDNNTLSPTLLIKNNFSQLLKSKFFDKELLKKSIEQLLKTYKQSGFWDAKIMKEELIKGSQDHHYTLTLHIEPGCKYIMGNVNIPKYEDIQTQLTSFYKPQFLQGFDKTLLLEQKQWISRYLKNKGYQKISIEYLLYENSTLSKDTSPEKTTTRIKVVDITWNISLHESEVKFGKTIILGNCTIPYNFIMKEICYSPGENWDKQKIELSLKHLKRLNVFESIQIYPGQETDELLYKPIFIKLIHADRYEVRTRFGLQQVGKNLQLRRGFSYKAGGSFYLKNLFNKADQGHIEADVTKFYRNISACYEFPWLLGRRIQCQFKIYDSLYQQPVYIGSKNSLYTATQQGFLWNLSHAFSYVTISGSTGIEFMGIKEADQPQLNKIIDYDVHLLGKKPAYLFCEPNIIWQKVDTLLNPHQGHLSFFSCKGMLDLDTKTSFFKLLAEHSQYIPASDTVTIAIRLRAGHVFNRCFNQLIPIERFYLGGASSLRGYERDYCPPFGCLTDPIYDQHAGLPPKANNLWRYGPQGGRTMVNLNTEIRFPIYKNLGGTLFTDSGALFKHSIYDEYKNKSDNVFAGSGFGIRYDTPIGPLRFDCAFKWKQLFPNFESRCVWYLTLGQAF